MWTEIELIDFSKREVEKTLRFQLSSKKFNYLVKDLYKNLDKDTRVEFVDDYINWYEENKTEKITDEYFSTNHYIPLKAKGELKFTDRNSGTEHIIEHKFSLFINMWFHFDTEKPAFSFDIYDESKNTLKEYNNRIWEINDIEGIKSLSEEKNRFDNKDSAHFFTDVTRLEKNKPPPFHDFDTHDDIVMCHQDIVFAIGELFAYKPYITDFTLNPVNVNGEQVYQYFPSFFDKRYLSTSGRILELLYNYWDKIGDILAPYFTPRIPENRVYFGKVIDNISVEYQDNPNFNWLKEFKLNEFQKLNSMRKQIVHYNTMESQISISYRNSFMDIETLQNQQNDKENLTEYFKSQYKLTIEGFYHAVKLIENK